jgi:CheY-like chemotaxis protein
LPNQIAMKRAGLIVDDDESTRFVLARALEGLGFRVVVADDGADVPDLLVADRFDLLVVDLYMPGMNGFELLRRIRRPDPGFLPAPRTPSGVRVLVVSGEGHPASISNAKGLGADDYLVKPVDIDRFEQAVRRMTA